MTDASSALEAIQSALPAWDKNNADQGVSAGVVLREPLFKGQGSLSSCYAVTELGCGSIAAAAIELSRYVAALGGDIGELEIDRRLCSLWFGLSTKAVDWEFPSIWDAVAGDYTVADGWIRLHTNKPEHREKALQVLGCDGTREAVAAAVLPWRGRELEAKIVEAGGCAAQMLNRDQWLEHPQGAAVSQEPLIAWSTISRSQLHKVNIQHINVSRFDVKRPLAGIRVLDLTRVLAGPACTRFLAAFGADVLRIDSPDWNEFLATVEMSVGKRRAGLDLTKPEDLEQLKTLMAEADVMVHGYRPDALERIGLGNEVRAKINPLMVDVALSAYGWSGPWANRRGFDSLVQMSAGIADAGMQFKLADHPVPLPVQALDHATGYLMAAAVLNALSHRKVTGEIRRARLSLARTAELLVSLEPDESHSVITHADDTDYQSPLESTPWGQLARLNFPVRFENSSMAFDIPAGELRVDSAQWSN